MQIHRLGAVPEPGFAGRAPGRDPRVTAVEVEGFVLGRSEGDVQRGGEAGGGFGADHQEVAAFFHVTDQLAFEGGFQVVAFGDHHEGVLRQARAEGVFPDDVDHQAAFHQGLVEGAVEARQVAVEEAVDLAVMRGSGVEQGHLGDGSGSLAERLPGPAELRDLGEDGEVGVGDQPSRRWL